MEGNAEQVTSYQHCVGKKAHFQPASLNYVTGADTLSDTASSQSYSRPIKSGEPKEPPGHYCFTFFITVIVPYKLIKVKHAVGCKKSSYQTTDEKKSLI